jgi:hypothetical protein
MHTRPIKPRDRPGEPGLSVLLSEPAVQSINWKRSCLCFLIRQTRNLVLKVIFNLTHVAKDNVVQLAAGLPQLVRINFVLESFDLPVLVPVIEKPVQRRVLSLRVVTIFASHLVGPVKLISWRCRLRTTLLLNKPWFTARDGHSIELYFAARHQQLTQKLLGELDHRSIALFVDFDQRLLLLRN